MRPHFFNFEQIVVQPKLALSITFASMHVQRLVALIRIEEEAPASQTKNRWHDRCRNCRREDSNLHSLNGNQVLNLARLPIPPLRRADSRNIKCASSVDLFIISAFGPASRHCTIQTCWKR